MTTPENSIPGPQDQEPYITLSEAQARVRRWLDTTQEFPYFKEHPDDTPRAIFIKHEDLAKLREDYPETIGIRLYFAMHQAEPDGKDRLTGVIVPVFEGNTEKEDEKIYDFTAPCPIYCGTGSRLQLPIKS